MSQKQQLTVSLSLAEKAAKFEQEAKSLEKYISQQQAELELLRRQSAEFWAAAGRAILSPRADLSPNRPGVAAVEPERKWPENTVSLADRCFEVLTETGGPMLLAQIRYHVVHKADPPQLKKLSRSLQNNELRKAMQSRSDVFEQLGGRHWTLRRSALAARKLEVAKPSGERAQTAALVCAIHQVLSNESEPLRTYEILQKLDANLWPASKDVERRYHAVRAQLLRNSRLFQQRKLGGGWRLASTAPAAAINPAEVLQNESLAELCFQILTDSPEPLNTATLAKKVTECFPKRAARYAPREFRRSLTKAMRRRPQLFYRLLDGRWWLLNKSSAG